MKEWWGLGQGNLSQLEIIRDQSTSDALLEKASKRAKATEAVEAHRAAEMEAEKTANDKIRKDTLKELSSATKGSEDSCQNMDYWDGDLLAEYASISCQMSGGGIMIKDLKPAGWIITNVSKAGEQRTLGGKSAQYILAIKKVR